MKKTMRDALVVALPFAAYIAIGAGFARFVFKTSCEQNLLKRESQSQIAGILWPLAFVPYMVTMGVPCSAEVTP